MRIHELKRRTPNKKSRQIGRGGKRGKTAGRGTKGQKARAGHKIRPEIRDRIKKLPKLRGYKFASISEKPHVVNLKDIEQNFESGATVTPATLVEKGLVRRSKGKIPVLKVLADGVITKKLDFKGVLMSAPAKKKVEAVGGSIS